MRRMRVDSAGVGLAGAGLTLMATLALALLCLGQAGASGLPGSAAEDQLVLSRIPVGTTSEPVTLVRVNGEGASTGQAWPLPAVTSGANHAFTLQGNSTAVGALALSADGRFLTLAGYTTPVGGNPEAAEPRDVARVNSVGDADTSTTLGLTFEREKIRGAVTNDGTGFWVTGNGNGTGNTPLGGMVYAPLGNSGAPTAIFSREVPTTSSNKALNNMRTVQIAGGSLYTGSEKGTAGIYKVTGLPTTATAPSNPIAFAGEVDPISELPLEHTPNSGTVDTIYVAKESAGIFKYALEGSTWVEKGELAAGNFDALTGGVDSAGHFRLYAITVVGGEAENSVVTMTDAAVFNAAPVLASAVSIVTTAPAGTAFHGIAFAPDDPGLEVPGAPTAVNGTPGDGVVHLSWTAPGATGGSAISAYRITPFVNGVPGPPVTTPSAATTFDVTGLTDGTPYTFEVAAINGSGAGQASAPSAAITPETPGAPTPTITLAAPALEGALQDPANPTDEVLVAQEGTLATALTVEATASSNPAVAAVSGVSVPGTGANRTVTVTPAGGVGYADITLKVTGEEGKAATVTLHYAASAASPDPTHSSFYTGAADASTAQDVGGGYVIVGDDENNILRMYKRGASGAPAKTWNFNAQMGNPEEIDIEASARSGNTIYWTGSMGNSKSGNLKPDRSILFTTQVSGMGAATELTFGGYYRGLRQDLIAWDEANGNRFGFAAGAASGQIPKERNGFNVEGLEFAPSNGSTGYVGFRAPLSPATASGKALVVPVTNLDALATGGQNTTIHATFGQPILMDLGGLSVREIRKNAADEYLIIAGSYQGGGEFALYTWDGVPVDPPVRSRTVLPGETSGGEDPGSWESVVDVPEPLTASSEVELIMDNGSTDFYGDGAEAKALPFVEWQKDRGEVFKFLSGPAPVAVGPATKEFGSQLTGSHTAQIFTIENAAAEVGAGPLSFGSGAAVLGGTDAAQFSLANDTCSGQTLQPRETCSVEVSFDPTAAGPKSATLSVTDNGAASPQTVALSGAASEPAFALTISPTAKDFGALQVGSSSAASTFVVANSGTGPAVFPASAASLSGQFALSGDTCSTTSLAPGRSCMIGVAFAPTAPGAAAGTLTVADGAGGSLTASLSGSGVAAPVASPPLVPPVVVPPIVVPPTPVKHHKKPTRHHHAPKHHRHKKPRCKSKKGKSRAARCTAGRSSKH